MENELNEDIITSENNDDVVEETEVVEPQEEATEEVQQEEEVVEKPKETPEAKYARLKRQAEQLEKKFGFKPKPKQVEQPTQPDNLSSRDTIAFINAKVHEDDIDEVVEYARFKKISVSDALKSNIIKSSLAEKEEERNTATATNTSKNRGGNSRVTGESLLSKAQKTGEIPDSDEALNALIDARRPSKK